VNEDAELKPEPADTAALRTEFAGEFAEFRRDDWMQVLGGRQVGVFCAQTPAEEMTVDEVLAVISGLYVVEELLDPSIIHRAITDGSMSGWLRRLVG